MRKLEVCSPKQNQELADLRHFQEIQDLDARLWQVFEVAVVSLKIFVVFFQVSLLKGSQNIKTSLESNNDIIQ